MPGALRDSWLCSSSRAAGRTSPCSMLCALLLLPGLLGAAPASPVEGPRECAEGPAVWCQDLQAATRCGAVGHCRGAVWSQPSARSLPCDVCLAVVAATSEGLNPDATETDVLALLTKTCEWLPSQDGSAQCKGLVDTHSSAVLSLLREAPSSSTPTQLCAALTLCQQRQRHPATPGPPPGDDVSEAVAPFMANGPLSFRPTQTPEDAVCRDCVQLVTQLQDAVGANVSSLAEVTTEKQCESLGPGLVFLCKNYILRFLAPAERTLQLVLPEDTCRVGGFCEGLRGPAPPAHGAAADGVPSLEPVSPRKKSEVQMQAGLTCEVCLEVIQELDQWLESNRTVDFISHALERVCLVMPKSIEQQCVTLVDAYGPSLVQLVTRITPEKVCSTIRLCGRRRRARAIPRTPETTLPSPLLDGASQGSFCNGCKRLLGVSAHNLERKSTKRGILRAFKGGCRILPLPYMVQCGRFVDEYEPVLMASLMEMMDPLALCTKVGACHAPRSPLLGTDQCVTGPSFWCSSPDAAEMCHATEHCHRHVWKTTRVLAGARA